MTSTNDSIKIINPINQLKLFNYAVYFDLFVNLFNKKKMPNSILLTGHKGIGKATFAYHIVNYLLSKNEEHAYIAKDFEINKLNQSYQLINAKTHPNFFLIENDSSNKDIKIEEVRNLLKFVSKSTYGEGFKIVMIDNAENLNINSSNALLKSIEEPDDRTFFIIIHDSSKKILNTIKSRCTEFKFFKDSKDKREILANLLRNYDVNIDYDIPLDNFYYETPGNLLKYIFSLKSLKSNIFNDQLKAIFFLLDNYKKEKNIEVLSYISFFIQRFYNNLLQNYDKNLTNVFHNYMLISQRINNMKKYNLDEKNTFFFNKRYFNK